MTGVETSVFIVLFFRISNPLFQSNTTSKLKMRFVVLRCTQFTSIQITSSFFLTLILEWIHFSVYLNSANFETHSYFDTNFVAFWNEDNYYLFIYFYLYILVVAFNCRFYNLRKKVKINFTCPWSPIKIMTCRRNGE